MRQLHSNQFLGAIIGSEAKSKGSREVSAN